MSVHVHVVAETHALRTNVVTVGSYVYMYRYDIPLSDLISFAERARSALCKSCCLLAVRFFRYLARSFLFQGLLDTLRVRSFFRVCSIPLASRGPFLFKVRRVCSTPFASRGPFLFRLFALYARALSSFRSLGLNLKRRLEF